MPYQTVAILPGDRQKTIANRSDSEVLSEIVLPFVANGVIAAKWGAKRKSYQVLELRIYETRAAWNKKDGPLNAAIKGKRNLFNKFKNRAEQLLATNKPKVFIVMPIQARSMETKRSSEFFGSTTNASRQSRRSYQTQEPSLSASTRSTLWRTW